MKILIEKLWFFAAVLCLAATLLACGAVIGGHEVCEETSSEIVESGEIEAISNRQKRRTKRKDVNSGFDTTILSATKKPCVTRARLVCKSFSPSFERDHLNGNGVNLLI